MQENLTLIVVIAENSDPKKRILTLLGIKSPEELSCKYRFWDIFITS